MRVVSWSWIGDTARTPSVNVAQVVRQDLHLVHREVVVVMQHKISTRAACSLENEVEALVSCCKGSDSFSLLTALTWMPMWEQRKKSNKFGVTMAVSTDVPGGTF